MTAPTAEQPPEQASQRSRNADGEDHTAPEPPRLRRRPMLIAASVLLTALGALLGAWLLTGLSGTKSYIAVGKDIERGQVIKETDLARTQLRTDAAVSPLLWEESRFVVGEHASVDMAKGSLVTRDSVQHRVATPFALVAVATLALVGCAQERADERLPRDLKTSTSTDSQSTEQVAENRASQRVFQYVSGRNTVRTSPGDYPDINSIDFAEGKLATSIIADAAQLERKDQHQSGEATIPENPQLLEMDLAPGKENGAEVAPYVDLQACVDESETHLVDAAGTKVKGSTGDGPRPVKFHVVNRSLPSTATWRIAWTKDLKGAC